MKYITTKSYTPDYRKRSQSLFCKFRIAKETLYYFLLSQPRVFSNERTNIIFWLIGDPGYRSPWLTLPWAIHV